MSKSDSQGESRGNARRPRRWWGDGSLVGLLVGLPLDALALIAAFLLAPGAFHQAETFNRR
jgi:hypothetical protein